MTLDRIIEQYREFVERSKTIATKTDAMKLERDAKNIAKGIKKVKEISVEQAILILESEQVEKVTSSLEFTDPRYFPISGAMIAFEREFDKLKEKHPEVFMDADAERIRSELGLSSPDEDEVVKFKAKIQGTPKPRQWMLTLNQTKRPYTIDLPRFKYEGLAKVSPDLLWID